MKVSNLGVGCMIIAGVVVWVLGVIDSLLWVGSLGLRLCMIVFSDLKFPATGPGRGC